MTEFSDNPEGWPEDYYGPENDYPPRTAEQRKRDWEQILSPQLPMELEGVKRLGQEMARRVNQAAWEAIVGE